MVRARTNQETPVQAAGSLDWYWWDAGEPRLGWELQLAVADREEGYAWAISAHDSRND